MDFEKTVGGNAEKSQEGIIARDQRWADYIKEFEGGHPWAGAQINEAYEGIEFKFAGSPGKPVTGFDENELLAKESLTPDMQRDADAIRAHREYATKYNQAGVTLAGWEDKDPNKQTPLWIGKIIAEASVTVFKDIPAICDYLRTEAEKNREK